MVKITTVYGNGILIDIWLLYKKVMHKYTYKNIVAKKVDKINKNKETDPKLNQDIQELTERIQKQ